MINLFNTLLAVANKQTKKTLTNGEPKTDCGVVVVLDQTRIEYLLCANCFTHVAVNAHKTLPGRILTC